MKLPGGESSLQPSPRFGKEGLRVGKLISKCVVRRNYSMMRQRGQRTMLSLLERMKSLVQKQRLARPRWAGSRLLLTSRRRNGILKVITSVRYTLTILAKSIGKVR